MAVMVATPLRPRSSPYAGCTLATRLTITVVVPARNRAAPLSATLRALVELDYPDLRIIVVDGSDDEATRQAVRRLAEHHTNLSLTSINTAGSSTARDLGAALSHGDIVAYADDDCIVSPHWLHAIAVEFADPTVAAVFGRLLPHPDRPSRHAERAPDLKAALHRQRYSRKTPPWRIGHAGNMAVRRDDLLAIGGFDPLLGAGSVFGSGEGADIAYRLLSAGRTVAYSPAALAYHHQWRSWPEQRRLERIRGIGAGAQFGKYLRRGDPYGVALLAAWVWRHGLRRVGDGALRRRDPRTVYLGLCQLVYPWIGLWRSLRYPIDKHTGAYRDTTSVYRP